MRGLAIALMLLVTSTSFASRTDYANVKRKFDQIEKQQVKPGSRISISSAELNSYVQTELPKVAPPGIRQPLVVLNGHNTATGTALIDFVKLRSAQGKAPNWILRNLFQGEHELSVTARVSSGAGKATVDIEKVELGGIPISGGALDFLIRNYLVPNYPDAKIGQPFALKYRMDRLEVSPGMAYVTMSK
ncbi:MAG: hypothetical protein H7039_25080 [Bryobacteraceae bacterium]|nr:hypothetical protein [Bryobacteraceae bacterium]